MRSVRPLNFITGLIGLLLLVAAPFTLTADVATEVQSRLSKEIKYLASDELEGRGIGTAGLNKAAEYLRSEFQAAGLDVTRVKRGGFQTFSMNTKPELGSPNSLRFVGPDGKSTDLKLDLDYRPCSFGGSGKIEGDLVFAGYAIDSADKNYHDLRDVDVKGKVVIVLRRAPRQSQPHGPFVGPHGDVTRDGELQTKLSNAAAAGAKAFILVNDSYTLRRSARDDEQTVQKAAARVVEAAEAFEAADKTKPAALSKAQSELSESVARLKKVREAAGRAEKDPLLPFGQGGAGRDKTIPAVHLKVEACDRLLKAAFNKTAAELEASIDADFKPLSAPLKGWKVDGVTTIRRVPAQVKNVIGVLEGQGPLADETVVVGAHYDHLGRGGAGSLAGASREIHHGADDNASGTVGILEVARRLSQRPNKLPRRVVFIAFTGEEEGLIGSARYVKEPVFPLDKTIAMINLDMVGRLSNDKLTVFGTGTSNWWKNVLEASIKAHHLQLIAKPEGFGPSDHSSFYAKKIPVLHFFTGTHSDYHRPGDVWEKINFDGMARVVDVVEEVVAATAQTPQRPAYVEIKERAVVARTGSRPYFGSIPDFSSEESGYSISGVAPGSPADLGGLKAGDRIIQFGMRKITGLDDFDLALRKFSSGEEVPVVVTRGGKDVKLKVVLGQPK